MCSINVLGKLKKKIISFFYLIKIGTIRRKLILLIIRQLSKNTEEFKQVYKEKNIYLVQMKIPSEILLKGAKNQKNGDIKLLINRNVWEGFFSNFTYVLLNLHIANIYGFDPIVDMQSKLTHYTEKTKINNSLNVWDYYFRQDINIDFLKKEKKFLYSEPFFKSNFNRFILENTSYMNFLFNKYIKLKEDIVSDINSFIKNEFCGSHVIGVHWRGTDAGRVKNEIYIDNFSKYIDPILKRYPYAKIFICTEENDYLNTFRKRYGERIIYTESFRSNSDIPPHLMKDNPRKLHRYKLGREVLIDALLLSKSNTLIGRRSNVFNSALIMGNVPKKNQIILDGLGI